MDSDKGDEFPVRRQTITNGRPGSPDRCSPAQPLEYDRRPSATLTFARFDADEIAQLSAPPPGDVHAPAEGAAGTYTILNGDHSFETQASMGDGFAQRPGPITILSDIPASDISTDYLASLFAHNPASPTSTNMSTHNQRQPPAGARANRNEIGPVRDLARPTSIDTSCSDDQVRAPAEVSLNAYGRRVAETLDSEPQHELDELLARIDAFVAGDPNASMLEEQPSALPAHGRQRSLGAPHGPEDMAAAARLLQLRAVEVPNRESYASEQQTSREQAEKFGEDLEDSTELWQVASMNSGRRLTIITFWIRYCRTGMLSPA